MTTTPTAATVRAWAKANGIPVGQRGRLSPQLVAQYQAAALDAAVERYENGDLA